jgi:hypothetical protein
MTIYKLHDDLTTGPTAVCIGDLIEGDPLGSARPDGAACQKSEQLLQIPPECSSILASDDL